MFFIEPIRNFYARFERPLSSVSLLLGFAFDIITLKRVDTLWENLWILGHLIIVGIFIILIHRQESEAGDEANPNKKHFWYVNILQFFFGGLLSTYLVFYFRSADILATWPFVLLLAGAFWANESLKRHYIRFSFQISLFFLSIYSFAIFLVPVVLHQIGAWVFILSGFISLALIYLFIIILFHLIKHKKDKLPESKRMITTLIIGIFCVVNFLYFTNLIPPIPLSLEDAGVYHSITKNTDGNYEITYEDHGFLGFFQFYKNFTKIPNSSVYVYSAIFSPSGLDLNIIHEWQHYDEIAKKWVIESTIALRVMGGRDGGFRTYSMRSNLASGKWRVGVKTERGQIIGYENFNIISSDSLPVLSSGIK